MPDQLSIKNDQSSADELDPRLIKYIHEARQAGLHDEIIWGELKKVGWADEVIKKALRT